MADLSQRFTITVSRNSPNISRAGFGTPLIFGRVGTAIIPASQRTRTYSGSTGLTDMVTDGFATTDPVYLAAAQLLAQTPRVTSFKVGRGALSFVHAVELAPTTFALGETLQVTVTKGTTSRTYTRTAGGVSLAAEATAIAAIMNADASGWGVAGTAELTIAAPANVVTIDAVSPANDNEMWYYSARTNLGFEDVGVDRGIATDLTAIETADPDWYCLCLADAFGATEIAAAAAWIESRSKVLSFGTGDTNNETAASGIINTLKGLARARSFGLYTRGSMSTYPGPAYAGRFLPEEPGEVVWADKTLSGVTSDSLTTAIIEAVEEKSGDLRYGNTHTITQGVGNVFPGVVCSGEYIDIIRLTDWTVARVREDVFAASRASKKIPFTDAGVALIKGVVLRRLEEKVPNAFVAGSTFFDAPLVADVSAVDKAARRLPDVTFGAQFAGAILFVGFTATLTY